MTPLLRQDHRNRLHWFIARHYLRAGRGRGFLSLITWIALGGVIVGVTALVVVIGVMSGMQEDLQAKILESTPHIIVLESGTTLRLHEWEEVVDLVMEVDGVVGAAPFVLSQVSVARTGTDGLYPQSANLYGISIDTGQVAPTEMERQIVEGSYNLTPPESGLPPLLMGVGLADRMQLFEGDTLLVVSFENLKMDILGGLNPTMRQFEVTGVFTTGLFDYDMQNVYTTLGAAQELVGITNPGVVGGVGVRTRQPELADEVRGKIQESLGFPFYAESWMTTNRALFSALRLEKIAMGLILGLIVLVAAFNIVSTLVMVVADRTREIGILKAMGMTRRGIMRVFVLQGAWIGVAGTMVGTACGLISAFLIGHFEIIRIPPDVYFVDHLPVSLNWVDVLGIVVASVTIAFVATIYPAWKASRLEPVDAIRHE